MDYRNRAVAAVAVTAVVICLLFTWACYGPEDDWDCDNGACAWNDHSGDWMAFEVYNPDGKTMRFSDLLTLEQKDGFISFTTSSLDDPKHSWTSRAQIVSDREAIPVNENGIQMYLEDGVLYCIEFASKTNETNTIAYTSYVRGDASIPGDMDNHLSGKTFEGIVNAVDDEGNIVTNDGFAMFESESGHMIGISVFVGMGSVELNGFVKNYGNRSVLICTADDDFIDFVVSIVIEDDGCLMSGTGDSSWSFVSEGATMPELSEPVYLDLSIDVFEIVLEGSSGAYVTELMGEWASVGFMWTGDSFVLFFFTDLSPAVYIPSGDGHTYRALGI